MAESEFKNRNNHEHSADDDGPAEQTTCDSPVTARDVLLFGAASTPAAKLAAAADAADAPQQTADAGHFFEGVEKLLEIWFEARIDADLRKVTRSMWDALLKTVHCEIISFTRNDDVDAYVLSESSMFVSKRRWILKTCGTTTPLHCLEPMLRLVAQHAGYDRDDVQDVFYSRKNFKRPELQLGPYRAFDAEVAMLDALFDEGRAYCLGSVRHDCWYVYTFSRDASTTTSNKSVLLLCDDGCESDSGTADHSSANASAGEEEDGELSCNSIDSGCGGSFRRAIADRSPPPAQPDPDQTIEILMTELDAGVMELFTKRECADAKEATVRSGIDKLLPGMVIDDYLFEPCGYSMNGVGENNIDGNAFKHVEGCYMTIHITPEPEFSYVSFETNVSASKYGDLIKRVIETFQPNKFVVTIFANKTSAASSASSRELDYADSIGRWKRKDIQFCRFPSYDLTYAHYCKFPS